MTRRERIESRLAILSPHFLGIKDVSAHHKSHFPSDVQLNESHLELSIASAAFHGLTRIEQHRIINNLLREEFQNGLHALVIKVV